jgi:hypothetical protein
VAAQISALSVTRNTATLVGFLVAPLVSASTAVVVGAATGGASNEDPFSAVGLIPIFYFFSFLATILLAVPIYFVLLHYELIRWWSTVLAGILIGSAASALLGVAGGPVLGAVASLTLSRPVCESSFVQTEFSEGVHPTMDVP